MTETRICPVLRCTAPIAAVAALEVPGRRIEVATCAAHARAIADDDVDWSYDGETLFIGEDARVEPRRTVASWSLSLFVGAPDEMTLTIIDGNGYEEQYVIAREQAEGLADALRRHGPTG